MEIKALPLKGALEISPVVFKDERGDFFENYNESKLANIGIPKEFPLEFQSMSKKGVIRGLHFQKEPFCQGKLVRVVSGKVLDVIVDLRKSSPTYKKWISLILSAENKKMLWIPVGFCHGFLALEDNTVMLYKVTAPYNKEAESGIIWNDKEIGIDWQLDAWGVPKPILSERDKKFPSLNQAGEIFK